MAFMSGSQIHNIGTVVLIFFHNSFTNDYTLILMLLGPCSHDASTKLCQSKLNSINLALHYSTLNSIQLYLGIWLRACWMHMGEYSVIQPRNSMRSFMKTLGASCSKLG